jgi:DNA-directed RNA polymerase subunit K/omega
MDDDFLGDFDGDDVEDYDFEDYDFEDDEDEEEENQEGSENEEENQENQEDNDFFEKVESKNVSDFDRYLSRYDYSVIIANRAKLIDNGYKSFLDHDYIKSKNLTKSIEIAEEEFKQNLLEFCIVREKDNGDIIKITQKNFFNIFT